MGHLDYASGQWVHDAKDDPDFDAAAAIPQPSAAPAVTPPPSAADRAREILAARAGMAAPPVADRQVVVGDDGLVRPAAVPVQATIPAPAPPMPPADQREVVVGDDGLVRPARKEIAARARDARERRRNRKED